LIQRRSKTGKPAFIDEPGLYDYDAANPSEAEPFDLIITGRKMLGPDDVGRNRLAAKDSAEHLP
jgi:hypothetical protein